MPAQDTGNTEFFSKIDQDTEKTGFSAHLVFNYSKSVEYSVLKSSKILEILGKFERYTRILNKFYHVKISRILRDCKLTCKKRL